LTALPLPVAIGFAVLAQGLYDLRTAANRTMVWVTLSALVAGIYALVIRGVSALMHTDSRASWLTWVGAGVVAVSFAPLRDALQSGVNRVTYGRWDQPYDVLAALGQRLEATGDVDRLLQDVGAELAALGLQDVVVEDEHGVVLVGDAEASELASLQLTAYGEPVGRLAYRDPSPPLRNRDRQLLDDLAGHLGGVLHARRLTTDLERARERLVLAREEERRRLRRDLHDGLGPALAGHLLRLDVVAGRLRGDPAATAEVDRLREELRATVAEVRRVVEGLRPPALDELGLVGALDQVVQRLGAGADVAIRLDVDDLPTLPAAVEVAAYRIVTEAVTNVVRHASASRCDVRIRWANGRLDLRVTDDGVADRAAARARRGHGLQTMRERAEELRGRLTVRLTATGSTVHAQLPVTPAQRLPSRATAGAR
jgi:signal transduction histidine kinase